MFKQFLHARRTHNNKVSVLASILSTKSSFEILAKSFHIVLNKEYAIDYRLLNSDQVYI